MDIDRKQVESIVEKVLEELHTSGRSASLRESAEITDGVFQEMEEAIQAAIVAHKELLSMPLAVRKKIIQVIREVGRVNREEYARMELAEAELGAVDGTMLKMDVACGVPGMEDLEPDVYTGDKGIAVVERLPVGVVASINAVTNASPGIIHNSIMILASGNTLVNNPHPKTKIISSRVVRDVNRAIVEAGGPSNCVTTVENPGVPTAQFLMTHPKIDLITVTGGHRVVEFATKTGKRVISGGPGNPPVVVDETADLENAAECIVRGASFSHCTPCSSEKEIFVVDSVADQLKKLMVQYGAYELTEAEGKVLTKEIFNEIIPGRGPSVINMDYIGKPPNVILQKAIGLDIPSKTKIAILETDKEHPLIWTEQIMPILPFVRCRDAEDAMTMGIAAEQGMRHTIVFHSTDLKNLARMSSIADASQFVKNGPSFGGIGIEGEGFKSLVISTGGEGLVRPRTFTQVRRCIQTDNFSYRPGTENEIQRPR